MPLQLCSCRHPSSSTGYLCSSFRVLTFFKCFSGAVTCCGSAEVVVPHAVWVTAGGSDDFDLFASLVVVSPCLRILTGKVWLRGPISNPNPICGYAPAHPRTQLRLLDQCRCQLMRSCQLNCDLIAVPTWLLTLCFSSLTPPLPPPVPLHLPVTLHFPPLCAPTPCLVIPMVLPSRFIPNHLRTPHTIEQIMPKLHHAGSSRIIRRNMS